MRSEQDVNPHEQIWLLLPWLANGRLSGAEREHALRHVESCALCRQQLLLEQQLCRTLTMPDRVIYAPGPSFRKLLQRIDAPDGEATAQQQRSLVGWLGHVALWRPPGLAWAVTFVLAVGLATGLGHHRSPTPEPAPYRVHTDPQPVRGAVLHIALERSLTIDQVDELLQTQGARVVEREERGIFGVAPASGPPSPEQLRALAARLEADPRVRWVEPLGPRQAP